MKLFSRPKKPLRRWIAIFHTECDMYTDEETQLESIRVIAGVNVAGIASSGQAFVRNVEKQLRMFKNGKILDFESLRILDDELAATVNDEVLREEIKNLGGRRIVAFGTFFWCHLDAPES